MSNLLSKTDSTHKAIQAALKQNHNGKGFNLVYSELNLCIDLPKLHAASEDVFIELVKDFDVVENEMQTIYDLSKSFIKEGEIKFEHALNLQLEIQDE